MNFSDALTGIKAGKCLTREGWNGKGMWVFLVPSSKFVVEAERPIGKASPDLVGHTVYYRDHIDMKTADGQFVPWFASQSDLMADDWVVYEGGGMVAIGPST